MSKPFVPDYTNFSDVMANRRSKRLSLYEHNIFPAIMESVLGVEFQKYFTSKDDDLRKYFREFCRFFREMRYDVVSYENCIGCFLPKGNALSGGMGAIQTPSDFDAYPWDNVSTCYWSQTSKRFDAITAELPPGMKIVGGVGNGVFELAECFTGLEYLPLMQVDYPELYERLFVRIGDIMLDIWATFLDRYGKYMAAARFGDDLGFKSSLLTNPATVRQHIFPQYKRVIDLIHSYKIPFLWHSCGCIFEVMDDAIALGINAKHSNEDAIAPFSRWIELYGKKIGLIGGIDLDLLCQKDPDTIYKYVLENAKNYMETANGFALGSGNSIPRYVPPENYLAMIRAGQELQGC